MSTNRPHRTSLVFSLVAALSIFVMAAHGESVSPPDPTQHCPLECPEGYEPDWRVIRLKKGRTTKDHQEYLEKHGSTFKLEYPHALVTAPLERYTAEQIKTFPKKLQENFAEEGPNYYAQHLKPEDIKIICSDTVNVLSVTCAPKVNMSIYA
jgi:hypothetical protein